MMQNETCNVLFPELKLYHGESWELLIRRWSKLEKDFKLKSGNFDISKIPDIYDCIKYDLQHNQKTLEYDKAKELFQYSKALADIVIPQVSDLFPLLVSMFIFEENAKEHHSFGIIVVLLSSSSPSSDLILYSIDTHFDASTIDSL